MNGVSPEKKTALEARKLLLLQILQAVDPSAVQKFAAMIGHTPSRNELLDYYALQSDGAIDFRRAHS